MTVDRKIGDHLYSITPLPALASFTLQADLAPALAAVAGAVGGDLASLEVEAMAKAAGAFFAALPRDKFSNVVRELLSPVLRDGAPLFTSAGNPFDVVMAGSTLDTWKLLLAALEVNYPDFFGALAALRAAGAVNPSAASPTSPTSGPATA